MMLTDEEWELVFTSLEYTKKTFSETGIAPFGSYPSYEYKAARIKSVSELIKKLRAMRQQNELA